MSDRDYILAAIAANQPAFMPLPDITTDMSLESAAAADIFMETLQAIGGHVAVMDDIDEVNTYLGTLPLQGKRVVSNVKGAGPVGGEMSNNGDPHELDDIEIAIINAHFGVAENGAVWVTEPLLGQRVLPFITQNLIVVLPLKNIVVNMHQAYQKIGDGAYGFGTFIAGPSKTADIEQSLVLGAHGSRSMTVFLVKV